MVNVSHNNNRVRVGPPNSEIRWRKWGPKIAPKGKMVKSLLLGCRLSDLAKNFAG